MQNELILFPYKDALEKLINTMTDAISPSLNFDESVNRPFCKICKKDAWLMYTGKYSDYCGVYCMEMEKKMEEKLMKKKNKYDDLMIDRIESKSSFSTSSGSPDKIDQKETSKNSAPEVNNEFRVAVKEMVEKIKENNKVEQLRKMRTVARFEDKTDLIKNEALSSYQKELKYEKEQYMQMLKDNRYKELQQLKEEREKKLQEDKEKNEEYKRKRKEYLMNVKKKLEAIIVRNNQNLEKRKRNVEEEERLKETFEREKMTVSGQILKEYKKIYKLENMKNALLQDIKNLNMKVELINDTILKEQKDLRKIKEYSASINRELLEKLAIDAKKMFEKDVEEKIGINQSKNYFREQDKNLDNEIEFTQANIKNSDKIYTEKLNLINRLRKEEADIDEEYNKISNEIHDIKNDQLKFGKKKDCVTFVFQKEKEFLDKNLKEKELLREKINEKYNEYKNSLVDNAKRMYFEMSKNSKKGNILLVDQNKGYCGKLQLLLKKLVVYNNKKLNVNDKNIKNTSKEIIFSEENNKTKQFEDKGSNEETFFVIVKCPISENKYKIDEIEGKKKSFDLSVKKNYSKQLEKNNNRSYIYNDFFNKNTIGKGKQVRQENTHEIIRSSSSNNDQENDTNRYHSDMQKIKISLSKICTYNVCFSIYPQNNVLFFEVYKNEKYNVQNFIGESECFFPFFAFPWNVKLKLFNNFISEKKKDECFLSYDDYLYKKERTLAESYLSVQLTFTPLTLSFNAHKQNYLYFPSSTSNCLIKDEPLIEEELEMKNEINKKEENGKKGFEVDKSNERKEKSYTNIKSDDLSKSIIKGEYHIENALKEMDALALYMKSTKKDYVDKFYIEYNLNSLVKTSLREMLNNSITNVNLNNNTDDHDICIENRRTKTKVDKLVIQKKIKCSNNNCKHYALQIDFKDLYEEEEFRIWHLCKRCQDTLFITNVHNNYIYIKNNNSKNVLNIPVLLNLTNLYTTAVTALSSVSPTSDLNAFNSFNFTERIPPYYEFSIYSFIPIFFPHKNVLWPSLRHLYKAQKFYHVKIQERIRLCKTHEELNCILHSKCLKRFVRPDWHKYRDEAIKICLLLKLQQHPKLQLLLIFTSTSILKATNYSKTCNDNNENNNSNMNEICEPASLDDEKEIEEIYCDFLMTKRKCLICSKAYNPL